MNVTILGSGSYGRALACMFRENNCKITMWDKYENAFLEINNKYKDTYCTTNLKVSLDNCDLIVIAVPIPFLDETMMKLKNYYNNEDIVIASKGISVNDKLLASSIIKKYISCNNIGVISGGTFANDMEKKMVMGITLGTVSNSIRNKIKEGLENKFLKIQYIDDIIGVEICGAIKNVMAIGFGILDGANYPESTRFLYLTHAIYEIKKLIVEIGGMENTIMSYAGIDDIMMTCTSSKSRNYTLGKMIGQKNTNEEIEKYKKETTIEGLGTTKAIYELSIDKKINLEIVKIIYDILYCNEEIDALINYLENIKN